MMLIRVFKQLYITLIQMSNH